MQLRLKRSILLRTLLSLLIVIYFSEITVAQKKRVIKLNPDEKTEYQYEINQYINIEDFGSVSYLTQAITGLKIKKTQDGNFIINEKIKALNINSANETTFSLDIVFEPYSRQSVFQQYIKNSGFESKIDKNGKIIQSRDISLLANDLILRESDREQMLSILAGLNYSDNLPYLNRTFIKGDTFMVEKTIPANEIFPADTLLQKVHYKIIDSDDKETLLFYYYNGTLPFTDQHNKMETKQVNYQGTALIDNKTGLPKFIRQLVQTDKYEIALTMNRLEEKTINAGFWSYLKNNNPYTSSLTNDSIQIVQDDYDEMFFKDEKTFSNSIDKIRLSFYPKKYGYFGKKKCLGVESENINCFMIIKLNSIKCYYCNKQTSEMINYQDESARTFWYHGGIYDDIVPFSSMGDFAQIDSVVINCTFEGQIGYNTQEIKRSDTGTLFKKKNYTFQIINWENNTCKIKGWDGFRFYDKNGNELEAIQISEKYSFINEVSKLLSIPEKELTIEQFFLFTGINGEQVLERTVEYSCNGNIDKIIHFEADKTVKIDKKYVVKWDNDNE